MPFVYDGILEILALRQGDGRGHFGLGKVGRGIGVPVGADDHALEALALGQAVPPHHGGRVRGFEPPVADRVGDLLFLFERRIVGPHGIAGKIDDARAEPVRPAEPQPGQRALDHPPVHGEVVAVFGDLCTLGGHFALKLRALDLCRADRAPRPRSDEAPSRPAEQRLVQVVIVRVGGGIGRRGCRGR